MFLSFAFAFAVLQSQNASSNQLNSALVYSPDIVQNIFDHGFEDAKHQKTSHKLMGRLIRPIGNIRTNVLSEETVSWLYAWPWQSLIYQSGFDARKKFWSDDQITKYVSDSKTWNPAGTEFIYFTGEISLYPSFGRGGGVVRDADASDLDDVHIVMKVGDKIYQPRQQPGKMLQASGTGSTVVSTPETSTSETTASASDNYGNRATGSATTTNVYYTHFTESYKWYEGDFQVVFDLKDPDGTFRITPDTKEIEIIVVYGPNERHAKYKPSDFDFTSGKK